MKKNPNPHIFYRLKNPLPLDLITASVALSGIPAEAVSAFINMRINP